MRMIARAIVTGIIAGVVFWSLFLITMHLAEDQFIKGAQWAALQCPKKTGEVIEGVYYQDPAAEAASLVAGHLQS